MMTKTENLPVYLREHGLFCLWRYEDQDGRRAKVPYNPNRPGSRGDSSNRKAFASLDKAIAAAAGFDGLGVGVFDEIAGIDIDHCLKNGALSPLAQNIVDRMNCYTEVSPSGEGLRLLFLAPGFSYNKERYYIKRGDLEVYIPGNTNRILTVTGNVYRPGNLEDRTDCLPDLLDEYMLRPQRDIKNTAPPTPVNIPDQELIGMAKRAKNGAKFRALWNGSVDGYPSHSEADLALCEMLAFWTGRDAERMDALFRQSGLMRGKWDRQQAGTTYGALTIREAIDKCTKVFTPTEGLRPTDFTDLGQAQAFIRRFGDRVRHSPATRWLVYDGVRWAESEARVRSLVHALLQEQKEEARELLRVARAASDFAVEAGEVDEAAKQKEKDALRYRRELLKYQNSPRIDATLREAVPAASIDVSELDKDPYLLNTPAGTVDLRTGLIRDHDPWDFCTKVTACSPSLAGRERWQSFLDQLTDGDQDLQKYLQTCMGMAAIGEVKQEKLLIAYSSGGTGKSTFFNAVAAVMGDYSGSLSAELLTTGARQNFRPEYADLRGKRLIIAAELEEGMRLNTAAVKKLSSTDPIKGEKKYKDPFDFRPSHSLVLYTNHLPKVGTNDNGTWDRLVVIPFNHRFRDAQGMILNYADVLVNEAGGSILQWIIDGAKFFAASGYMLTPPKCVAEAIEDYQKDNDWLGEFLEGQCITGHNLQTAAGQLYSAYIDYCDISGGTFRRSRAEFKAAMQSAGFRWHRTPKGAFYYGVGLNIMADFQGGYDDE